MNESEGGTVNEPEGGAGRPGAGGGASRGGLQGGEDRGKAMAASLVRTTRAFGLSEDGISLLATAHALAMQPRVRSLTQRHPLFLHPGHTALILLRDAKVRDASVLAAAALAESRRMDLRVAPGEAPSELRELLEAVPTAQDPRRVEKLVTAPPEVRLIAMAEHLDHVRHAHLLPEVERDPPTLEGWLREVLEIWGPLAERTHLRLWGRFRHWAKATERKLRRRGSG
ncbi:MAG: hypothetical protein ACE5GJ_12830 [Gemmatimonadota bacterium]